MRAALRGDGIRTLPDAAEHTAELGPERFLGNEGRGSTRERGGPARGRETYPRSRPVEIVMGAQLVNGVLRDYSVARQERMAMDHALPAARARRPVVVTIDHADELDRAQIAKLIPHLTRLP